LNIVPKKIKNRIKKVVWGGKSQENANQSSFDGGWGLLKKNKRDST